MRILVAEDEPGVAQFIEQGLTEAGYAVDVACDGQEGLAFALSVAYDVIVLDIMLPRMDGLAMLREIRLRGRKTPVLLLTARDTVDDRVRGLDSGADDYLAKPFAFPRSEWLSRQTLQSAVQRKPGAVSAHAATHRGAVPQLRLYAPGPNRHHQVDQAAASCSLLNLLHPFWCRG
jgi:DNA-binding response OmpR family regulator